MKKLFLILGCSVILASCASSCVTSTVESKPNFDSVSFYRHQVDSLKLEIVELYDQLDGAKDELQMREGEISYWGHKYDSCMMVLQKRKGK